ncbi:hypothetical protein ACTNDZ_12150 [Selenomonas montiformis]|uniref:hypothetical protein n=1 Tax=Selenomonas montiformis TaxID=2652285 RepID=UPI003F896FCF
MAKSKLLPCPFCGSAGYVKKNPFTEIGIVDEDEEKEESAFLSIRMLRFCFV